MVDNLSWAPAILESNYLLPFGFVLLYFNSIKLTEKFYC